jgi:hypothetical protein
MIKRARLCVANARRRSRFGPLGERSGLALGDAVELVDTCGGVASVFAGAGPVFGLEQPRKVGGVGEPPALADFAD